MKRGKIYLFLILMTILLSGCSGYDNKPVNNETSDGDSLVEPDNVTEQAKDNPAENNETQVAEEKDDSNDITKKTKDYILKGQEDLPEADKIKWSETFLNQVDIDSIYQDYLTGGGKADDIKSFAEYLTLNAPIQDDWQELFKKDLMSTYEEEVTRIEHLDGDLYQAYVKKDGSEVPYVVVNSRTGYFHG